MQSCGAVMQSCGHTIFEHNNPGLNLIIDWKIIRMAIMNC